MAKPKKSPPSAEYIAQQRALRAQKKLAQAAAGPQPRIANQFIQRQWLATNAPPRPGHTVRLLTYNTLAQTLIRRTLFPCNGNALKWNWRGRTLIDELTVYSPDIVCLQEVDAEKYPKFWHKELTARVGLSHSVFRTFPRSGKTHGNVVAFNGSKFSLEAEQCVVYDSIEMDAAVRQIDSRNTGLLVALRFNEPAGKTAGLIVATTHMFWHPTGSYERTRQLAVLMHETVRFRETHHLADWPMFLAGDFNSECFDSPYLCASQTPVRLGAEAMAILEASVAHRFGGQVKEVEEEEEEVDLGSEETEGKVEQEEEEEKVEKVEEEKEVVNTGPEETEVKEEVKEEAKEEVKEEAEEAEAKKLDGGPTDVKEKVTAQLRALLHSFDSLPFQTRSLYGQWYLDPTNQHPKNMPGCHEPVFSNWAHSWRGLLDYVFYLEPVDENEPPFAVYQLLKLPRPDEMGPEPSGQPRIGQYPSDHLCLGVDLGFD